MSSSLSSPDFVQAKLEANLIYWVIHGLVLHIEYVQRYATKAAADEAAEEEDDDDEEESEEEEDEDSQDEAAGDMEL